MCVCVCMVLFREAGHSACSLNTFATYPLPFRAAEIIYSLAVSQSVVLPTGLDDKLTRARRSLGLFQHHDGITGTAKNHVVEDYGGKYVLYIPTF